MPIIRATAILADNTGLSENAMVNVWHFSTTDPLNDDSTSQAIGLFLPAFYSDPTLAGFYSPTVSRVAMAHRIVVATVSTIAQGPEDDVVSKPIGDWSWTMSQTPLAGSFAMPSEVACCLSFRGDIEGIPEETGNTRPASRHRGRVFLGPFNTYASTVDSASRCIPNTGVRDAMLDAYLAMNASLKSVSPSCVHVVYSPTLGQTFPVVACSVDDAWDTIRSRGQAPQSRETRVVP